MLGIAEKSLGARHHLTVDKKTVKNIVRDFAPKELDLALRMLRPV